MPAQRFQFQPVAHQCVEPLKTLPHIRPSGRQIDLRRWSQPKHAYACSSSATRRRKVSPSKPRLTSIRRPPPRTTANSTVSPRRAATSMATQCGAPRLSVSSRRRRVTYRANVFSGTPRRSQNSCRLSPLASYSAASRSAPSRLRRRPDRCCCSSTPPLNQTIVLAGKMDLV